MGGLGAIGGAIGTKAVAGVVTAAVLTAGAAVEVKQQNSGTPVTPPARVSVALSHEPAVSAVPAIATAEPAPAVVKNETIELPPAEVAAPTTVPAEEVPVEEDPATTTEDEEAAGQSTAGTGGISSAEPEGITPALPSEGATAGAHSGTGTVVVTVGGSGTTPPPSSPPADSPPAEPTPPPPAESEPASGAGVLSAPGEAPVSEL